MTSNLSSVVHPAKILILGIGDVGAHIARLVVEGQYSSACLLAGRSGAAEQWAQLLQISTGRDVRAARVNGQDIEALRKLFADFEPDLIVQCATLLAPYAMKMLDIPQAKAIVQGGFALQTAAQLPVIRAVMQAHRSLGLKCPVINCSYPDVTNAVLASEGLAPTVGIGNVSMMAWRFQRFLLGAAEGDLRVIGHHSQLPFSLAGEAVPAPTPAPLVYLNGRKLEDGELLLKPGLRGGLTQNYLAASTIRPILHGLLDRNHATETHAPGVLGLEGGYPIQFTEGEIRLRLPDGLSMEEAVAFNKYAAAGDGIDHIGDDGTLFYTKQAKEAVAPWCPELAEPLKLGDLNKRLALLKACIGAN